MKLRHALPGVFLWYKMKSDNVKVHKTLLCPCMFFFRNGSRLRNSGLPGNINVTFSHQAPMPGKREVLKNMVFLIK